MPKVPVSAMSRVILQITAIQKPSDIASPIKTSYTFRLLAERPRTAYNNVNPAATPGNQHMKSTGNPDLSLRPYQPRQTKTTAADSNCNAIGIQLYLGHELVFLDTSFPIALFALVFPLSTNNHLYRNCRVSWGGKKKQGELGFDEYRKPKTPSQTSNSKFFSLKMTKGGERNGISRT